MNDIIGTPIAVGDLVATDVMRYRSSALRIGTITATNGDWIKVSYDLDGRKQSVNRKPNGVVKVSGKEKPAEAQP
jgi:hypothetical protein